MTSSRSDELVPAVQAVGRSDMPFDEMVRLGYLYITNWSLYDDVKWLWRIIPSLVSGRHAY